MNNLVTRYELYYGLPRPDGVHEFRECKSLLPLEVEDLYNVCMALNCLVWMTNSDYFVKAYLLEVRKLQEEVKGLSIRQESEIERKVRGYLWEYFVLVGHYDSFCQKYQDAEFIHLLEKMKNSPEYHIAKVFRNFATHVDGIVHNLSIDISNMYVYANRNILAKRLENKGWKKDKKDIEILKAYPYDKIDIIYIIETAYNRLDDVQKCLNKILYGEQRENIEKIKRFIKLVKPEQYNTKRWMILVSDILGIKEQCLVDWDAYSRMQERIKAFGL